MHPTVLIGFDAFDRDQLERLLSAGRLPNLKRIIDQGYWTPLVPNPAGLHSLPWPGFLQGRSTLEHGWYAVKRWNPSAMRLEARTPEWFSPKAFWEELDPERFRIALLDVPFAPRPGKNFRGLCLQGWQNHDQLERYAFPAGLWRDLTSRYGRPIMRRELCAPHSHAQLAAVRREVLAATGQFGRICTSVLQQEPWNLFLAVFGAAHRIGHYLWDTSQAAGAIQTPGLDAQLRQTLEEVYCYCDRMLGELVRAAPAESRIIAFSLHGMQPETGWCTMLPKLLGRISGIDAPAVESAGTLFRFKQALPTRLVEKIIWHLPYSISDIIVPLWSKNMYDWNRIRCFALPGGDSNGLIRINLKGREARGTVEPGREYDELCTMIEEGLRSFLDIETGTPVIAGIERMDRTCRNFDVRHSRLPDMIVYWNPIRAFETRGVVSARHGEIRWDPGWKITSGRSGDHSNRGWLAACGADIPDLGSTSAVDIAVLASDILRWVTGRCSQGGIAGADDWQVPLPEPQEQ